MGYEARRSGWKKQGGKRARGQVRRFEKRMKANGLKMEGGFGFK